MSDDAHDIKRDVKKYILVFVALLVGTLLTVWAYTWHFDTMAVTVAVALFIASIKATLVAGFFMHLISEKKMIYSILVFTVFFFIGMMFLTVASYYDTPKHTVQYQDVP